MNATDGRPTIGHHPRASRKAAPSTVSLDELLTVLHDNRDARQAVTRMLGWSSLLPEDAIIGLRSAQVLIDCIEEGVMNAVKAQRGC